MFPHASVNRKQINNQVHVPIGKRAFETGGNKTQVHLMLEESQAALDDNVLKDGSWWDIDGAALVGNDNHSTL